LCRVREIRQEFAEMNEDELRALLGSNPAEPKRGWRCPDDNQLAGYVNKQIDDGRKRKLEAHFADCKACLETLAFVAQMLDEPAIEPVPASLVVKARQLADHKPSVIWRWVYVASAVCLVIVTTFIVWNFRTQRSKPPSNDIVAQKHQPARPTEPLPTNIGVSRPENNAPAPKARATETRAPELRGESDQLKPTLIFPREGSTIEMGQPIRWKPVIDVSFYEVNVVTEDGGSAFNERTNSTQFQLHTAELRPGRKYFVRVVAHLKFDRTVTSDLVGFRVAGP